MYVYICISVPVNPRHLDCAIVRCSLRRLSRQQNAPLGHHRPRNMYSSILHFITARCLQIVVNVTHCSSEGYTPVGDSTILADIICPAWLGTLSMFSQVKRTTRTLCYTAQQGWASLCSSKYVGVNCPAAIQCSASLLYIPSF